VLSPDLLFQPAAGWGQGGALVLLELQILHGEASPAQGAEQLVLVEAQGLEPLGVTGPHHEPSAVEPQGAAVGSQLGAGNPRPGLPEPRQAAFVFPLPLQAAQGFAETLNRRPGRRHQEVDVPLAAGLVAGGDAHGRTLVEVALCRAAHSG